MCPDFSTSRSNLMRAVRSRDTQPEIVVRKIAHSLGFRFRLHSKHLPGRPDIRFPRLKKIIFVHGCFWHQHDCGHSISPKVNVNYWRQKLRATVRRDAKNQGALRQYGYDVLVVWECELTHKAALTRRLLRFLSRSHSQGSEVTIPMRSNSRLLPTGRS